MAERENVRCGGAAEVEEKISVEFGDLSLADLGSFEAGLVDELAGGLVGGRIFEKRASGRAGWLFGKAELADFGHDLFLFCGSEAFFLELEGG